MNKRLGKGISALIHSNNTEKADKYIDGAINVNDIIPNKNQPRKDFEDKSMQELINSIKEKGILQPITVRELKNGKFELIAGERRFRSAEYLKLKTIPAYIINIDTDMEMMEFALIENIQRQNLNPIEEAEGYEILRSKYKLSQKQIAGRVGKSRSDIANTMRLLKLPKQIRSSLKSNPSNGEISKGHARALISLKDSKKMFEIFAKIIEDKLSVRDTENIIKNVNNNSITISASKHSKPKSHLINKIEAKLNLSLNTKVMIKIKKNKSGTINIRFADNNDLNRILKLINNR